jgi:spermidine/putrescine transport system permease protein
MAKETLNKLLRARIVASRARSLLAYPFDMSRRSLRGSLHSGLLASLVQRFHKRSIWLWLAAAGVYLFLYTPLLVVMVYSFNASKLGVQWTGFTLHWYQVLFQDEEMLKAASNSLMIALLATAAATVLGTMAGFALQRYRLRLLPFLVIAPLAIPELLSGVSLLLLFVLLNFTLGLTSILLAHIAFCISFVAIVVRSRLAGMDASLVEAARDLGATPWQSFRLITLPLIAPGILAGALLAFTLSIDDFVITFFTAGVDASTLPLRIYTMIKITVTPEVNAISTILVLVTLVLVAIASRLAPSALRSGV